VSGERGHRALWRRPVGLPFVLCWGDVGAIAHACGITVQAVSQWKRIPERHLPTMARRLNTTPERLRPDLAIRRHAMNIDIDPKDAAMAERAICEAVDEVDGHRVAVSQAAAREARCALALAEAKAEHDRAVLASKRARAALTRVRSGHLASGIPAGRLGPLVPSPSPAMEGGGVKT